jgi:hypothetical protein
VANPETSPDKQVDKPIEKRPQVEKKSS